MPSSPVHHPFSVASFADYTGSNTGITKVDFKFVLEHSILAQAPVTNDSQKSDLQMPRCWGNKQPELDSTERLHFHFSFSCIGEGNGNPLQYSCLENPRDGEAWWAAVHWVAQSRTRLKQLSSSRVLELEQEILRLQNLVWQKALKHLRVQKSWADPRLTTN